SKYKIHTTLPTQEFITAATITQLNQEFIAAATTAQLNQESTTTTTTQPTQEFIFQ
ncbi:20798_t:CDS:1, partial [Entrophospora sp. SA101]